MKKRITEDLVRRLRPGRMVMSSAVIGFGVRKSPKTRKVAFFVRRVIDGKEHRATIGNHYQLSVRDARKLAMARILEIERAVAKAPPMYRERVREVAAASEQKPVSITLGELWARVGPGWLAGLKPITQKNLTTIFEARILPKWSTTPVAQIRNGNLTAWYRTFLTTTPQYGADATRRVIQLLKLGHEQELVESLPNFKIRFVGSKRRKPLEKHAILKLVGALEEILKENRLHSNANAIISIMNTGERATAGLELHTREVSYHSKCITKTRKFDQVKTIPISDYTASFLQSIHPPGGGYFFPNKRDPSRPIKYAALLAFLKTLCAKHEIFAVDGSIPTIHSMRHTYATLLEERGLPVSHIQRLMGHTSIRSTLRYIHGTGAAAREGANLVEVTRANLKVTRQQGR